VVPGQVGGAEVSLRALRRGCRGWRVLLWMSSVRLGTTRIRSGWPVLRVDTHRGTRYAPRRRRCLGGALAAHELHAHSVVAKERRGPAVGVGRIDGKKAKLTDALEAAANRLGRGGEFFSDGSRGAAIRVRGINRPSRRPAGGCGVRPSTCTSQIQEGSQGRHFRRWACRSDRSADSATELEPMSVDVRMEPRWRVPARRRR
jgi:hypothetical protein